MTYHFDSKHADKYGVEEAIFLQNLIFWIAKNRANKTHFYEGSTWTYNSAAALAKLFTFWNPQKIVRIVRSLVDQGAVKTGNFNRNSFDRTLWYSLVDEGLFFDDSDTKKAIIENDKSDLLKTTNGDIESNKSLTDKKPDSKPDVVFPSSLDSESFREKWGEFIDYRKSIKKPLLPQSQTAQLKSLQHLGERDACREIERTIANGWQGIHPQDKASSPRALAPAKTIPLTQEEMPSIWIP